MKAKILRRSGMGEKMIHINNCVPKPGILQSLLSFHFAVRLTTVFMRSGEEESTRPFTD